MGFIEFYQNLLQEPGSFLFWFNTIVLGLLTIGIISMIYYEFSDSDLPVNLIYSLLILGLFVSVMEPLDHPSLSDRVFGGLAISVLFLWVRLGMIWLTGDSTVGFNEVKFAGTAGLWVGFDNIPILMIIACVIGVLMVATAGIYRMVATSNEKQIVSTASFPFSPTLGLSMVFVSCLQFYGFF